MRNFQSTSPLKTKRCILRHITLDDAPVIFEMRSNPEMIEYLDAKVDIAIDETITYITNMIDGINHNKWFLWVILDKMTQQVLGTICIWNFNESKTSAEIGYGLIPHYQHQGYMREVLTCVTKFAFEELKLLEANICTEKDNLSSRRLAEKCGYHYVKEVMELGTLSSRWYNICVYQMRSPLNDKR